MVVIILQQSIKSILGKALTFNRISIEDFKIINGLSSGAYGKVCLVQKISSGDYFALKIIDRQKTIEKQQEECVAGEVNIMKNLNTDYAVKLYYSFQNETHLFFVMEYMNGGDLGNVLQQSGQLEEKVLDIIILFSSQDYMLPR